MFDPIALHHFQASLATELTPDDAVGKKTRKFALQFPDIQPDRLPEQQITRSKVFELARNDAVNTSTVCAAVLAWGGMRIINRNSLLEDNGWLEVADKIRSGNLDRQSAYERFDALQQANRLKGMGPAYFTKLIYFLTPRVQQLPDAYIMDQWASCSINLLRAKDIVLMDVVSQWKRDKEKRETNFIVSRANRASHYEAFCEAMSLLAAQFGLTADQIDRAVLGGGSSHQDWRLYVTQNRLTAV